MIDYTTQVKHADFYAVIVLQMGFGLLATTITTVETRDKTLPKNDRDVGM